MSFISKIELKYQLTKMGVKVEGNHVKKKDLKQVLADEYDNYCNRLDKYISKLKKQKQHSQQELRTFRLLAEMYNYIFHIKPRGGDKMWKFIDEVDEIINVPESTKLTPEGHDLLDEGIEFLKDA